MPREPHKDFIDVWAPWRTIERQLKSGAVRTKTLIDFNIPTLVVNPRARAYNAVLANALRDLIQRQIRESEQSVKPSTIARRQRYARDGQSKSYKKRYAGGRTGETPPSAATGSTRVDKYGLDSGRLVNGMVMRLRRTSTGKSVATMNVTNNRLRPELFGDVGQFARFRDRLRQISPALNGNFSNKTAKELREAVTTLNRISVATSEAELLRLQREQRRELLKLAKAFIRVAF